MTICACCKKNEGITYKLVTIKTITHNSFKGPKKYEAMGDILDLTLCDDCIEKHRRRLADKGPKYVKATRIPILMIAAGVFIMGMFGRTNITIRLSGAIFIVFGIASIISSFKKIKNTEENFLNGNPKRIKKVLIMDLAGDLLPKRNNDAKLSYVLCDYIMNESLTDVSYDTGVSNTKLISIRKWLKRNIK